MDAIFSLRIVTVDYFMSKPIQEFDESYSEFKTSEVQQVPVVRVFGSTPAGQSTCLYIHGIFPYLLIPYHGPGDSSNDVEQYLQQVATNIDHALNSNIQTNRSSQEHVYKIILVQARPYYGYHEEDKVFMKVYFYHPADIKKSCELLQAGAILNQSFQPHEAHIPFILQVFLDYNLYGMNMLYAKACWFRKPIGYTVASTQRSLSFEEGSNGHQTSECDPSNMDQLQNFNWNILRRGRESDDQSFQNVSSNSMSNSEELHTAHQANNSCSQFCSSILSKTLPYAASQKKLSSRFSVLSTPGSDSKTSLCPLHTVWTSNNIPSSATVKSPEAIRSSTCALEVDILAADILNRNESQKLCGKNPGIVSIWDDERARRRQRGDSSQIPEVQSQTSRANDALTACETTHLQELQAAIETYMSGLDELDGTKSSDQCDTVAMETQSSTESVNKGSGSQFLNVLHDMEDEGLDSDDESNMTQPWEHGIENLLQDSQHISSSENSFCSKDNIPQVDGTCDEQSNLRYGAPAISLGETHIPTSSNRNNNQELLLNRDPGYSNEDRSKRFCKLHVKLHRLPLNKEAKLCGKLSHSYSLRSTKRAQFCRSLDHSSADGGGEFDRKRRKKKNKHCAVQQTRQTMPKKFKQSPIITEKDNFEKTTKRFKGYRKMVVKLCRFPLHNRNLLQHDRFPKQALVAHCGPTSSASSLFTPQLPNNGVGDEVAENIVGNVLYNLGCLTPPHIDARPSVDPPRPWSPSVMNVTQSDMERAAPSDHSLQDGDQPQRSYLVEESEMEIDTSPGGMKSSSSDRNNINLEPSVSSYSEVKSYMSSKSDWNYETNNVLPLDSWSFLSASKQHYNKPCPNRRNSIMSWSAKHPIMSWSAKHPIIAPCFSLKSVVPDKYVLMKELHSAVDEHGPHSAVDEHGPHSAVDEHGPHSAVDEHGPHSAVDEHGPHSAVDEHGPHSAVDEHGPHSAVDEHGPHSAGGEHGPHSAVDEHGPHSAVDEHGPHSAVDEHGPHSAGGEHGPHSAGDEHGPHSAGDEHGPHSAGDEHGPHSAGDEHGPHSAVDEHGPHSAVDEHGPHSAGGEHGPHSAVDEHGPHSAVDEHGPHSAGGEHGPHSAVDEHGPHSAGGEHGPHSAVDEHGPHSAVDEHGPHSAGEKRSTLLKSTSCNWSICRGSVACDASMIPVVSKSGNKASNDVESDSVSCVVSHQVDCFSRPAGGCKPANSVSNSTFQIDFHKCPRNSTIWCRDDFMKYQRAICILKHGNGRKPMLLHVSRTKLSRAFIFHWAKHGRHKACKLLLPEFGQAKKTCFEKSVELTRRVNHLKMIQRFCRTKSQDFISKDVSLSAVLGRSEAACADRVLSCLRDLLQNRVNLKKCARSLHRILAANPRGGEKSRNTTTTKSSVSTKATLPVCQKSDKSAGSSHNSGGVGSDIAERPTLTCSKQMRCSVFVARPLPPTKGEIIAYLQDAPSGPDATGDFPLSAFGKMPSPTHQMLSDSHKSVRSLTDQLPEFESRFNFALLNWREVLAIHLQEDPPCVDLLESDEVQQAAGTRSRNVVDAVLGTTAHRSFTNAFAEVAILKPAVRAPTPDNVRRWLVGKLTEKRKKQIESTKLFQQDKQDTENLVTEKGVSSQNFSSVCSSSQSPTMIGMEKDTMHQKLVSGTSDHYCDKSCVPTCNANHESYTTDVASALPSISDVKTTAKYPADQHSVTKVPAVESATSITPSLAQNCDKVELLQSTPVTSVNAHSSRTLPLQYTPIPHQQDCSSAVDPSSTKFTGQKDLQGNESCDSDPVVAGGGGNLSVSCSQPFSINSPTLLMSHGQSGIDGPTANNTFGFQACQHDLREAKALHDQQHITVCSMELHVKTRFQLRPDPEFDPIQAIFYSFWKDSLTSYESGAIICSPEDDLNEGKHAMLARSGVTNLNTVYASDEKELLSLFMLLIIRADPDILLGYEVQMLSWGYLLARAEQLGVNLCQKISRVPGDETHNRHNAQYDVYGADNASEIHIVGRIVLNLWRLLRSELALYDYKFENVAFHLLHERYPLYSHHTLTRWFTGTSHSKMVSHKHSLNNLRSRVVDYYMCRVLGNLKLMDQQDLVGRTSELARLFGIQFYEVLTRGTQFRVESMMLRMAHSLDYVAVTPSTIQRAGMKAPECIALVMEPLSRFYTCPVIVVDFQSLYPSMIIAYNYCFSTCLGRIQHLSKPGPFTFGCTSLNVSSNRIQKLLKQNNLSIAPNAVAYVKANVRKGVLPTLLEEILNTRIMVKDSMKKSTDEATKRMLDHRQLGLKLIANVTYGYTSASFSGRMPCVEIADSIVHKARETLERAIKLVQQNEHRWNGRVVYGDTDSMFIALPEGTSKSRAFKIGREIVDAVTNDNPRPVKLKLEKIYQPCILQTKKRYVGYAYESEDQKEPIFDAKGIETVRRDGCPAVAKILEQSLKILFSTQDISKVRTYVRKQCTKILEGRAPVQDCTIAREYRGAKYYKPGAIVPALILARKMMAEDRRSEPRVGERVPYVVVHGMPGTPLFQLVRHPLEVLNNPRLRLHGTYYVTKMILPALDRVMSLLMVDVFQWYREWPRNELLRFTSRVAGKHTDYDAAKNNSKKVTISQYFDSSHCLSCGGLTQQAICQTCLSTPSARQKTSVTLMENCRLIERKYSHVTMICANCTGSSHASNIECLSLACPIITKRIRSQQDLVKTDMLRNALHDCDLF